MLDDALVHSSNKFVASLVIVSILIVLDDALVLSQLSELMQENGVVSILIVLDDALVHVKP